MCTFTFVKGTLCSFGEEIHNSDHSINEIIMETKKYSLVSVLRGKHVPKTLKLEKWQGPPNINCRGAFSKMLTLSFFWCRLLLSSARTDGYTSTSAPSTAVGADHLLPCMRTLALYTQ